MEKVHIKRLTHFIYVGLAAFFFLLFVFTSLFILFFQMVGVLDFAYFPSKLAMATFFGSVLFSLLAIRNGFGKLILTVDLLMMLFMIVFGP